MSKSLLRTSETSYTVDLNNPNPGDFIVVEGGVWAHLYDGEQWHQVEASAVRYHPEMTTERNR